MHSLIHTAYKNLFGVWPGATEAAMRTRISDLRFSCADHDADEYSPTANAGGDDPWEAAAAEAAHPTQPEEATAPWPASPAVASPALGTGMQSVGAVASQCCDSIWMYS